MSQDRAIKATVLGENNRPTGEIKEIDPNRIRSPPCNGNCGYTTSQCHLLVGACKDYICPNKPECQGLINRQRIHLLAPICQTCQVTMDIYK